LGANNSLMDCLQISYDFSERGLDGPQGAWRASRPGGMGYSGCGRFQSSGFKSPSMVGISSLTVGWIGMALWMVV